MKNTGALSVTTPSDREIVITRVFNAPRHLVYEACTRPELLKRWLFGPPGWSLDVCDLDLRPGGGLRMEWRGSDGAEMGLSGVYHEVVPPQRIVHTELFDEDWTGGETLVTWALTEEQGRTTLAMTVLYSSGEARDGALQTPMAEGMGMGYDRLEEVLESLHRDVLRPSGRELVIQRLFDASRELVFRAWTQPELLMRWWGPRAFTTPFCKLDLRVGGGFHLCMRSADNQDMWVTGVYRDLVAPERIVCTDSFADADGNVVPASRYGMPEDIPLEMLLTITFEDYQGKTKMTLRHAGLPSSLHQDASGGWNESLDKLAEQLALAAGGV